MGESTKFFIDLVDSSEMACSLRYEDISGCPYNSFTPRGIAVLSIASTTLAIIALIAGM